MGIVWLVKGETAGLGWHFVLYTFADRVPPGWNSELFELPAEVIHYGELGYARWWKCLLSKR